MRGMKKPAWQIPVSTSWSRFGKADSHVAAAIDSRSYDEIYNHDMQSFIKLMPELDALMPAHVIYDQVDPNPAGFSPFWIQESFVIA